jgi:hypothetical protein
MCIKLDHTRQVGTNKPVGRDSRPSPDLKQALMGGVFYSEVRENIPVRREGSPFSKRRTTRL